MREVCDDEMYESPEDITVGWAEWDVSLLEEDDETGEGLRLEGALDVQSGSAWGFVLGHV